MVAANKSHCSGPNVTTRPGKGRRSNGRRTARLRRCTSSARPDEALVTSADGREVVADGGILIRLAPVGEDGDSVRLDVDVRENDEPFVVLMSATTTDHAVAGWQISPREFPRGGSFVEQASALVRYASLAPSGRNTQPWLFRLGDGFVDVLADRMRRLPVVDPTDRALTISVGAAIETLRIAAQYFRYRAEAAARIVAQSATATTTMPGASNRVNLAPNRRPPPDTARTILVTVFVANPKPTALTATA
jgi:hypothetical protein